MSNLSETISFDNLADRVFKILKSHGYTLKMYKDNGEIAFDPSTEARKFFVKDEGMMVAINQDSENSELKVYISDETNLENLKPILNLLRNTANTFGILYNLRKYDKKLQPKEFAFLAYKAQQDEKMDEGKISEAKDVTKLAGSSKSSYQKFGKPARLVVRHTKAIDETRHAARTRNIDKIFIENAEGERLKFPVNWLQGARTMTRHISEGGQWSDDIGEYIKNESIKFVKLREFVKRNKSGLNEEATESVNYIKEHAKGIVKEMRRLQGPVSYRKFAENYDLTQPTEDLLDEEINSLTSMFTMSEDDDAGAIAGIIKKNKNKDMTAIAGAKMAIDTGNIDFMPPKNKIPKFNDKKAEMAYQIGDAAARVKDNYVSIFLSSIVDKIEHGDPISKKEVDLVKEIMPMSIKEPMETAKSTVADLENGIKSNIEEDEYNPLTGETESNPLDFSFKSDSELNQLSSIFKRERNDASGPLRNRIRRDAQTKIDLIQKEIEKRNDAIFGVIPRNESISAKSVMNDFSKWVRESNVYNEVEKHIDNDTIDIYKEENNDTDVTPFFFFDEDGMNTALEYLDRRDVDYFWGEEDAIMVPDQEAMGLEDLLSSHGFEYSNEYGLGESNFRPDTDPYGGGPNDSELDDAYVNAIYNATNFIDAEMAEYIKDPNKLWQDYDKDDMPDILHDLKGDAYPEMRDEISGMVELEDADYDRAFDIALKKSKFGKLLSADKLINDLITKPGLKHKMQDDPEAVIKKY